MSVVLVVVVYCSSTLTLSPVEDADASVSAIMDLVPPQPGIAVQLDPHPCHGVVEDLVLDEAEVWDRLVWITT